jgi:hypothetical protein
MTLTTRNAVIIIVIAAVLLAASLISTWLSCRPYC